MQSVKCNRSFMKMAHACNERSSASERKTRPKLQSLSLLSSRDIVSKRSGVSFISGIPNNVVVSEEEDGSMLMGWSSSSSENVNAVDICLGHVICTKFVALSRCSLWWQCPCWGTCARQVPLETQFLLLKLSDGSNALLLPLIINGMFRATLHGQDTRNFGKRDDLLFLRIESGNHSITSNEFKSALFISIGDDPFELISYSVEKAASLSGCAKPRSMKVVPKTADLFGWCTWDAFYSKVSSKKICEGIESFASGGIKPGFIIIDDGWQQTDVDMEFREDDDGTEKKTEESNRHGTKSIRETDLTSNNPKHLAKTHKSQNDIREAIAELLVAEGDAMAEQIKGEIALEEEESMETRSPGTNKPGFNWDSVRHLPMKILHRAEIHALHLWKQMIDNQRSDSWVMTLMSAMASGPLRASLQRFYAHSTDHSRRLTAIEANAKFASINSEDSSRLSDPGGNLSYLVEHIKNKFDVKFVYVWHAMGGFWGGLSLEKDMPVAKYKPKLLSPKPTPGMLQVDPSLSWIPPTLLGLSLPLDPRSLHQDMHRYLASSGVDGVKVDVQSSIGGLAGTAEIGGPGLAKLYHESLEASVEEHFPGNHLINCMCHSTEDLYNMMHSNWARASDDFYPLSPESHTTHVANCAYNALFIGEIAIPDWDMFHSLHPAALLHASARAISGSPIYVSDKPLQHDFDLLCRLVLPDSSIFRCINPARPTLDCLYEDVSCDNRTVLKIWNRNAVTSVIGAFNVQGATFSRIHRKFYAHSSSPPTLDVIIRPTDVPEYQISMIEKGIKEFAMYSDRQKHLYVVDAQNGLIKQSIPVASCDVVVVSPIISSSGISCAPIGLIRMLNAGGSILAFEFRKKYGKEESNHVGAAAVLTIRGCGIFLMYSSCRPQQVDIADKNIDFQYDKDKMTLTFDIGSDSLASRQCVISY